MSLTATAHVWVDDANMAWIDDTNVKVIEVVLDKIAYGSSPEEIHFQYPHLSLAQVYAAISYYFDHQAEIDAEIEQQVQDVDALRAKAMDSPAREKLHRVGKLP
jgi:uncharacterized protein (DUF433 family)